MIDTLLETIAPHYCYNCQKIGSTLCDNCKYNITLEPYLGCVACGRTIAHEGICDQCKVPYDRAWCGGERSGDLQLLIGGFKFQYTRTAYKPLADILLAVLPELPNDCIVVPIPTVASHIRERGYDHTSLLARRVAKKRGLRHHHLLERVSDTKQRDADRTQRWRQAESAFRVSGRVLYQATYLLVDDVVTTGATIYHAAKQLKDAGAHTVWVGAVARQPLD